MSNTLTPLAEREGARSLATGSKPTSKATLKYERIYGSDFKPGQQFWVQFGTFLELLANPLRLDGMAPELRGQFARVTGEARSALGALTYTLLDELANLQMLTDFGLPKSISAVPVFMQLAKGAALAREQRATAANQAERTIATLQQLYLLFANHLAEQAKQRAVKQKQVVAAQVSVAEAEQAVAGVRPVGAEVKALIAREEQETSALERMGASLMLWLAGTVEKVKKTTQVTVFAARGTTMLPNLSGSTLPMTAS